MAQIGKQGNWVALGGEGGLPFKGTTRPCQGLYTLGLISIFWYQMS